MRRIARRPPFDGARVAAQLASLVHALGDRLHLEGHLLGVDGREVAVQVLEPGDALAWAA